MFGTFVFLQFTVLGLANHAGEGYLSIEHRELVYYALQVFVISGYLLYSLFFRFCTGKRVRSIISFSAFGIFFICMFMMLTTGHASYNYVIISMIAALCLGGIGGAAHLRMSIETFMGSKTARCMGLGSAAAVVLQYLLQIRLVVTSLLSLFMLAAFLLFSYLLLFKNPETVIEDGEKPEETPPLRIVLSVLITVIFLLFACFYNEYIHHLQIRSGYGTYNVYSWPRLMLVPGYLLFAVIGDRKNGKYVPIASLCIMLVSLLTVVLIEIPEANWLNMCLFYFSISAFTSYYLLTFWRLAPGTGTPALWAPFGRILDSGMVLLTGALRVSSLSAPVILGIDIAGVAIVILIMAVSGDFALSGSAKEEPNFTAESSSAISKLVSDSEEKITPVRSPEDTLERMQNNYHLTPREADVLRELVMTEDKQTVICERLSIQVKTLQDYVTRLYRKTGVSTRTGLTNLYHETRTRV